MGVYVGLDVSLKQTSVCVIDEAGKVVWRGSCATSVAALAEVLKGHAPSAVRIGIESGSMTLFLWYGLRRQGFQVVCLDASWAKKALSANPVKTDANDAEGLAQLVRVTAPDHVAVHQTFPLALQQPSTQEQPWATA